MLRTPNTQYFVWGTPLAAASPRLTTPRVSRSEASRRDGASARSSSVGKTVRFFDKLNLVYSSLGSHIRGCEYIAAEICRTTHIPVWEELCRKVKKERSFSDMKKNIMMRLASGLLVAVLLTTCAISGTFAKYVTAGTANDSARVAKWGVEVAANGQLIKTEYGADTDATDSDGEKIALTVKSSATPADNLVAPGTRNDDGINFGVTGTPEVAVNVKVSVDEETLKDVVLAAGQYDDPTGLVADDDLDDNNQFTATEYHPLKFTLTKTIGETTTPVVTNGTLKAVVDALDNVGGNYKPNTDLATVIGSYKLTWAWDYEKTVGEGDAATVDAITDAMDTTLGNMAASPALIPAGDTTTSTEVALDLSIVVTQID